MFDKVLVLCAERSLGWVWDGLSAAVEMGLLGMELSRERLWRL